MRLGVKAAPDDVQRFAAWDEVTFVETVLWGDDLVDEEALGRTAAAFEGSDVHVVHVPFTVPAHAGGREVDVAAADPTLRAASLRMWHASCDLAQRLGARWVVLHPGAIVPSGLAADPTRAGQARADALEHIEHALEDLGHQWGTTRLLMENMPSHYHRSDGTSDRCLAGTSLADLQAWMGLIAGICLDTSHAFLTPGGAHNLETMARRGGRYVRHLHLSDARAPDHEGMPFGDGDIDWHRMRALLADLDARQDDLSAVCEIAGGHRDDGAGFRAALEFCIDHLV